MRVMPADGSAVAPVEVQWTVVSGGGSLREPASMTDSEGVATATWTVGNKLGPQFVEARVARLSQAAAQFVVIGAPPSARVRTLSAGGKGKEDSLRIQRLINATYAAGGGIVRLGEGIFRLDYPIAIRSRIHLVGSGRGKTILRGRKGPYSFGPLIYGSSSQATVGFMAAASSSVSSLTIDHQTNGTNSNGLSLVPKGPDFRGAPPKDCVVADVKIVGGGNFHTYMIWNLRGENIRIVNNVVDGGISARKRSHQEGIESYGGRNVHISGNTVENIGNAAFNFGSAGLVRSTVAGLVMENNIVRRAGQGIHMGTAYLEKTGAQNLENVLVRNNLFSEVWVNGLHLTLADKTAIRDLTFDRNRIERVEGQPADPLFGIELRADSATGSIAENVTISNNFIGRTDNRRGYGVAVFSFARVRIAGNTIESPGHTGIFAHGVPLLEVEGNQVLNACYNGIVSHASNGTQIICGNTIEDWSSCDQLVAAIQVLDAAGGLVESNTFVRHESTGTLVQVVPFPGDLAQRDNTLAPMNGAAAPQPAEQRAVESRDH